jgi:hypothetical protein
MPQMQKNYASDTVRLRHTRAQYKASQLVTFINIVSKFTRRLQELLIYEYVQHCIKKIIVNTRGNVKKTSMEDRSLGNAAIHNARFQNHSG